MLNMFLLTVIFSVAWLNHLWGHWHDVFSVVICYLHFCSRDDIICISAVFAIYTVRPSVSPSVCHDPMLYQNGFTCALFHDIARNSHHVLHPQLPPRKRAVYNLRKLTHGLTIPQVCSLMRKQLPHPHAIFWRLLIFVHFVSLRLYISIPCHLPMFIGRHFIYLCVFMGHCDCSDSNYNKEATYYLLTYLANCLLTCRRNSFTAST